MKFISKITYGDSSFTFVRLVEPVREMVFEISKTDDLSYSVDLVFDDIMKMCRREHVHGIELFESGLMLFAVYTREKIKLESDIKYKGLVEAALPVEAWEIMPYDLVTDYWYDACLGSCYNIKTEKQFQCLFASSGRRFLAVDIIFSYSSGDMIVDDFKGVLVPRGGCMADYFEVGDYFRTQMAKRRLLG